MKFDWKEKPDREKGIREQLSKNLKESFQFRNERKREREKRNENKINKIKSNLWL